MRTKGRLTLPAMLTLLAMALAIAPAGAAAATTIDVNDSSTDAPLESGETTCVSTDAEKGCTLRAAVELANTDSEQAAGETVTVEVPAGAYKETLGTLIAEEGASVAIDGAGIGKTIVDGAGRNSVFFVEEDGALSVDGVTIEHGREGAGGGVYVDADGSLTVDASAIEDNQAGEDGGGIFAEWASTITIASSRVEDNVAGSEEAYEGDGGGIYAEPFTSVSVEQSTIAGNKAVYSGGGIYREALSEVCDDKVAAHVSKPRARSASTPADEGSGDALTITQSTIAGNTAEDGLGGGIDAQRFECDDDYVAKHASVHRSWTRGERSAHAATRATVKALRPASILAATSEMTIERSTIAKNRAQAPDDYGFAGYGGGIFEGQSEDDPIVNSTITENFATYDGGGIADESDVEELISDTVFDNTLEPKAAEEAEENEENEEAGEDARHAAQGVRHDTTVDEEEPEPGSNLAADGSQNGAIYLRDTIVAEPKGDELENCEGPIGSLIEKAGYNLDYPTDSFPESVTDTCGMSAEENDLVGVEPQLDPSGLQENGGPTQTIALLSSSPAIGFVPVAGNCGESEDGPGLIDQRGKPRPGIAGRGCDVGAYEYQEPPPVKKEEVKEKEPVKETVTESTPPLATPTATSTATTTTSAAAAAVSPFKIEAPAQCASKRDIRIHIQNVKQFGIVSAVVSIDGKDKRTLTGKQLSTTIDLVGLPKGTFTIEIVAHTRGGRTLHGKRVYHTCHTKLPGRSYIPL